MSRLLIEGGTTALRNVFDGFHPPTSLAASLYTNYAILNNLSRRRILNRPQWDKLFPPGGAAPDSNTFDITLLFLLLTNICGLSPPRSGWNIKPPSSDISLEANLARIKFFRNELYGHVTTTGINDPTFTAFWQEIGDALVALGLNKAEIARLRAEQSGEEAYLNVLLDWLDSEADIKTMLKKGYKTLTEEITNVQTIQQEESKTLHEVKKAVDTIQDKIGKDREDEVLKKLAMSEFTGDIEYHVDRFQTETREWIFEDVQNWLDDRSSLNRVMVVSGQAGMGKSVIAAVICKRMQEAGRLSGSHFCQHNNVRYRNPKLMLQSLAFHLSCSLPEYKEALVKQLSRNLGADLNDMGVEDLFALLFKEPLALVPDPGRNILMVIDGLDESEYQGRNELLNVISVQFCKLPLWIRFLVTTRPGKNIAIHLKSLKPFELKSDDERNVKDIRLFFEKKISCRIKPEERDAILSKLVQKSEGLMLYAYFVIEHIENNVSHLNQEQLERSVPLGISSIYETYFKRLESEFQKELNIDEEHFLQFLCAVMDARSPLPVAFIFNILGLNTKSLTDQRNLQKCINCISTLFPIRNNHLHIFHKSVKDWLTDKSCYREHQFAVEEGAGHKILSRLCACELDSIKSKCIHGFQESDTERYALQHGAQHMLQAVDHSNLRNQLEGIVDCYVTDPELLYAKLCVEDIDPIDDILCVQKQTNSNTLGEDSQNTLQALLFHFKKHGEILRENPQVIFQTLLNEEKHELSSKAAAILETKLPEMSYLELVDKKVRQGPVQARFDCTDIVVCFDVSPNLEHMVCECKDGTIHLWSLQSSRREWVRSLAQRKHFDGAPCGSALRRIDTGHPKCKLSWSFYRSVVFHPNGESILPGDLTKVYTLSGDLKPLFPSSRCRFSVCSFSGDKTRLLTDCTYNDKEIVVWNMANGEQIRRLEWKDNIVSFDLSQSGIVAAVLDSRGDIFLVNLETFLDERKAFIKIEDSYGLCGLMRFKSNDEVLVCGSLYVLYDKWDQLFLASNRSNAILLACDQSRYASIRLEEDAFLWPLGESTCLTTELGTRDFPLYMSNFRTGFYHMLGEESALVGNPGISHLTMLNVSLLDRKRHNGELPFITEIAFSMDGSTVYAITQSGKPFHYRNVRLTRVTGWTIRRSDLELQNNIHHRFPSYNASHFCSLKGLRIGIPLREGILLLQRGSKTLELWNNEFSNCVTVPMVNEIEILLPISEELVGGVIDKESCLEVHVFRTKRCGKIVLERVSKLPLSIKDCIPSSMACSSQFQIVLLGAGDDGIFLVSFIGETQVWKREASLKNLTDMLYGCCMYSPMEEFIAVSYGLCLELLDARTGEKLRTLFKSRGSITGCTFLCDGESLVCLTDDGVVRMFHVKSGDLLTLMDLSEEGPLVLAASPQEPLIAVGFLNTTVKLIRVKLPGLNDSRKAKGTCRGCNNSRSMYQNSNLTPRQTGQTRE